MLLMLILDMVMATLDTTASVMLMLTLLFCMPDMLDAHMPLSMVPSPMPLLPPLPDSSTPPMLVSAPTTWELLCLAKHSTHYVCACNCHRVSKDIMMLPNIGANIN